MAVDVLPNPGDPQMFNSRVDWSVMRFVISSISASLPVKNGTALGIYGLGNVSKMDDTTISRMANNILGHYICGTTFV